MRNIDGAKQQPIRRGGARNAQGEMDGHDGNSYGRRLFKVSSLFRARGGTNFRPV
jgi:hypothetical protein